MIRKLRSVSAQTTDGSSVTTAGIDTTGADLLIAAVTVFGSAAITMSDSKSNSWTLLGTFGSATDPKVKVYYSKPTSVGSAHTFTALGAAEGPVLAVAAFKGAHATPSDQSNSASGYTQTSPISSGSVTPTAIMPLVITYVGGAVGARTYTTPTGFTLLETVGDASHYAGVLAYKVQSEPEAVSASWAFSGAAANHVAVIASFLAAVVSSVPVDLITMLDPLVGETAGTTLFEGPPTELPDEGVWLTHYGGESAQDRTMGDSLSEAGVEVALVQLFVRNGAMATAKAIAEGYHSLLDNFNGAANGKMYYQIVSTDSLPYSIGQDSKRLWR